MAAPVKIRVDDPRYPSGWASLPDILGATWGTKTGQFIECSTLGWETIALPHFAVRTILGTTSTSGGGIMAFTPNEGLPVIITYVNLYVITAANGVATVNIGVATNSSTSSNNLITAADVHTNPLVTFDNITDIGASGKSRQLMSGSQSLTVSSAADTTGLTGFLYVSFIKI